MIPTVAERSVIKMSKAESEILDLEDRDTMKLNEHLEVTWEKIIGEPSTIRSPECAWRVSQHCFDYSRFGIYTFLSVLCAPIAACILGISFACLQFQNIWFFVPCLRIWRIFCGTASHFVRGLTHGILIPIMEAFGYLLSQIRIRTGTLPPSDELDDSGKNLIIV